MDMIAFPSAAVVLHQNNVRFELRWWTDEIYIALTTFSSVLTWLIQFKRSWVSKVLRHGFAEQQVLDLALSDSLSSAAIHVVVCRSLT